MAIDSSQPCSAVAPVLTEGEMNICPDIPGAVELASWFDGWPSFHDAEILSLHLSRKGRSLLRIHTWRAGKKVDRQGRFVRHHHVVVSFEFIDLVDLELADFSKQNVIASLQIDERDAGFRVQLSPSFGLGGWLVARSLAVSFLPIDSLSDLESIEDD